MKLLIVRLSAMGDILHALPLAENARLAGATVGWLAESRYAELLSPAPWVDQLFFADTKRWRRRPLAAAPAARALSRELATFAPDITIDVQGLWKSAVLARRAGAPVVGFAASERKESASALLCDRPVRLTARSRHVVDRNLALLEAAGVPVVRRSPDATYLLKKPPPPEVREFLESLQRPFAVYHPGAGRPEKAWGEENFALLAARLLSQRGISPVISWGPGDESRARRLLSLLPAAVLAPPLDFSGLAHAAVACEIFVGGDTGPVHLADALGARTLALFGPSDPARNAPYRRRESALRYNESTSVESIAERAYELLGNDPVVP